MLNCDRGGSKIENRWFLSSSLVDIVNQSERTHIYNSVSLDGHADGGDGGCTPSPINLESFPVRKNESSRSGAT